MQDEYDLLIKNQTWNLVDRPKGQRVADNRWVFKTQRNTDGSLERFKARLVARGFTQEYGLSYEESFSPVVRFKSIRTILAVAAEKQMKLKQFDVKIAFLNEELDEKVYMKQPIAFNDDMDRVCELNKGLYGLKQASRCWNKKLTQK